jgi:hypothetical protein
MLLINIIAIIIVLIAFCRQIRTDLGILAIARQVEDLGDQLRPLAYIWKN